MSSHSHAVAAGFAVCLALSATTPAAAAAPPQESAAADRGAPTLPLFAPRAGATLSRPVDVTARPTDPSGIRDVRFLVDGVPVSTDARAPYAWRLDPARFGAGPLVLTVTATDRVGNSRSYSRKYVSAAGSRSVRGKARVAADRGAPTLPLFAPRAGATLSRPVDVTARPTDPSGIRDVRFLVDGVPMSTDARAPYAWRLDPARFGAGPLVLTVTATDRVGNSRSYSRRYVSAPAAAPIVSPPPAAPGPPGAPRPRPVADVTPPVADGPAPPPSTGGGDDSDLRYDVQQIWAGVTGPGPISREEHAPFPGHQIARDDSLVAVTDIRQGIAPYSARFTVRDGDQPGSTSGERAEIYTGGNGAGTEAEGSSGYYSMAVFFPADFTSSAWTIFHQMHGSVSGSSPALSLYVEKDRLQAVRRGGSASSPTTSTWVIEPSLTRGRWHHFVYYARWSRGQDGVLKIWHRVPGVSGAWRLAVDSTGPMGFANSSGFVKPYPKFGIYRSSAESGTTVLHHGGFRLRAKSFAGAAGIFG